MSEEPEEEVQTGRLYAEDRRGRVYEHFQGDDLRKMEEVPPEDPEENWSEGENRSESPWLMRGVAALVVLALLGILVYALTRPAQTIVESGVEPRPAPLFIETASPEEIEVEAERVISGFMSAKTHRERSVFLVGGIGRLLQLEEFYSRAGATPPSGYGGKCKIEPLALEGKSLYAGAAKDPRVGKFWTYLLQPTPTGLLIDWEASVGFGEMMWEVFIREKPGSPIQMRVILTGIPAPLDLGISDEKSRTFEVSARGHDEVVVSSVDRSSRVAQKLAEIVPSSVPHPVNLILQWNRNDSGTTELKILQVVHNYWVNPNHKSSQN